MALKDLKSDLSKFRMPKKDPLENKKIDEVNKKTNQTPLSSMVDSAPKIPRYQTTTNKEGVEPRKFDNSSQFLGETTPTPSNNSEQFLGETTPSKMDNSENFLGETTPNRMSLEERYLGQTTPTPANNNSQFLGETTPTPSNNQSQFLGETTPSSTDNTGQFLGETTPSSTNNTGQFLGETNQTPANNNSQFLGETTPSSTNNIGQFLGETTQTPANNQSQFLGETTQTSANNNSQFLGETTPNNFQFNPNHQNRAVTPTDVNYFQDIHATGFNSNFGGVDDTKFTGINSTNTLFDNSRNSLYSNINDNKYRWGVSYGESFENAGALNSGEGGFGIGKAQSQRQSPSFLDLQYNKFNLRDDAYNSNTALFAQPFILRGIQRKGISKKEPQNWGIAGVDFDDGLIRGGALTSTVRAAIDAERLGKWMLSVKGLLWGVQQVGLQLSNSNVETVSGVRLTKVWTPVNTLLSAVSQHIGIHPTRHGVLPVSGPERYEFVQIAKRVTHIVGDAALGASVTGNRLVGLYNDSFLIAGNTQTSLLTTGLPFLRLQALGGPNSLYGLIPNGTFPKRTITTQPNAFTGFTVKSQYNPIGTDPSTGPTNLFNPSLPFDRDKTKLGEDAQTPYTDRKPEYTPTPDPNDKGAKKGNDAAGTSEVYSFEFPYSDSREDGYGNDLATIRDVVLDDSDNSKINLNLTETHTSYDNPFNKKKNTEGQTHDIHKNDTSGEIIKKYETVAYGKLPNRVAGDTNFNDFRTLLSDDNPNRKIAESDDYKEKNINTRVNFGNPGKLGESENRYEWWNTDKTKGGTGGKNDRYDKINALDVGESPDEEDSDLVNMWFQAEGGSKVYFRGTANGISETFTPNWESVKYNGRADQAYKYSTFERSLSFSFQVYATSRIEMKPTWRKLQYLSTMTMPQYGGDAGYQGTLVKFRLGNLYKGKLGFIESLSYTMSDETPWEISMLGSKERIGELPMGIDVSIGLKILGDVRPEEGVKVKVYDWDF